MKPRDPFENFKLISEQFTKAAVATQAIINAQAKQFQAFQAVTENISRSVTEALKNIPDLEWFRNIHKAGLTPNLGEARSTQKLKQYKKLLMMGYPIFWVPRAEVIEALLSSKTDKERKQVVINHKEEILADCLD